NLGPGSQPAVGRHYFDSAAAEGAGQLQCVPTANRNGRSSAVASANYLGRALRYGSRVGDDMKSARCDLPQHALVDRFCSAALKIAEKLLAMQTTKHLVRCPAGDHQGLFAFGERCKCIRIRLVDVKLE